MTSALRLSSTVQRMRASVLTPELQARLDARAADGLDLVALHVGDTHLDPPSPARFEAAVASESAGLGFYRYGATSGLGALREAVAARLGARGWGKVDAAQNVLVGAGGEHALFCALRAALDPGDEVIVFAPYWPLLAGLLQACGASVVEVPVTRALYEDPSTDVGAMLSAALSPKAKAIYLATPNNPDGKVLSRRHLDEVATVALERDLWVFADEVYADTAFDAEHVSLATLPGMRDRSVTISSFSKSHALAGARVGCAVGPTAMISAARRVAMHTVFNVPVAMQTSALVALGSGEAWVERARATYRAARDEAVKALAGAPVSFSIPEGGWYLFLDFTTLLDGRPLSTLLERAIDHGVLLTPGEAFGHDSARCARLCYTVEPPARVLEGIARLRAAMASMTP